MSWLRTTSMTFARQISKSLDPRHDYEPQACFSSFTKHWQQAYEIIQKSHPSHLHDDVLAVVNHLEQLSTLLVLEARARQLGPANNRVTCQDHLLSENMLDKLYEWSILTGKYENAVRYETLKLYGNLVTYYNTEVLAAEPFLRPLLKMLSGFRNELPPVNVEDQLVTLLNQLSIILMQNTKFIELFFLTTHGQNGSQSEFIIVRLLICSVHREGKTGACARDALLLCAKMTNLNQQLTHYMLSVSNTCPILATGLSGLYSLLPRTLSDKVHKLMPDDVNQVHRLMLFVDSLEFCNAVAEVAHPSIKRHLLDLLYQGFLVPVIGPALLQTKSAALQSGVAEQVAAMAYLELIIRGTTAKGLLRTVLEFVMGYEYDGVRVIDVVLRRLEGESQLSLVSLCLIETLVDLNCEDVMLELALKYLLTCKHLASNYSYRVNKPDVYRESAVSYLTLSPVCCERALSRTKKWAEEVSVNGVKVLDLKTDERKMVNGQENIAMDNLVHDIKINYGNPKETLISNYHAYLTDARYEIVSRTIATTKWSSLYQTYTKPIQKDIETKQPDSLISICTSGYETLKTSDTSEKEPHSLTSLVDDLIEAGNCEKMALLYEDLTKEPDSLNSLCGSSDGYSEDVELFAEESFWKSFPNEVFRPVEEQVRNWKASPVSIIGPLLTSLLRKAASLLECDLTHNVRVTSIISKLVSFPTPLMTSLFLFPGIALQPNVPSLFQIISKMKAELDELTSGVENISELVDKARVFLINREMALMNRNTGNDDGQSNTDNASTEHSETKMRSLSNSFSSMFGRRLSSSPSTPRRNSPTNYKKYNFNHEDYWNQSITLRSILNAVILDEWIKELSALAQEHALRLSSHKYVDDALVRTVAL